MKRTLFQTLGWAVAAGSVLAACATDPCAGRFNCSDGGGDAAADAGPELFDHLAIEPESPEVLSEQGSHPTLQLRVFAVTNRGQRSELNASRWYLEHERFGSINDEGVFTANGRAGGRVRVFAVATATGAGEYVGSAEINVRVRWTVAPEGIDPAIPEAFERVPAVDDPTRAVAVLYPLANARLPNNVAPPDIQWDVGDPGDAYRIQLSTASTQIRAYVVHSGASFRYHWRTDPTAWRILAESTAGETVEIQVDRLGRNRTDVVRGARLPLWLSRQGVFGSVFYWQLRKDPTGSDVLRIDATTGTRSSVFRLGDGQCVGCHTLSFNGRYLASTSNLSDPNWTTRVVDVTSTTMPPPDVFDELRPSYNSLTFDPTGTRLLASSEVTDGSLPARSTRLQLLDAITGERLRATGLPNERVGYPAWSPDGALIAYMQGGNEVPQGTADPTSIVVQPVTGETSFGEPRVLARGLPLENEREGGTTVSHPTWSPDGRFLAFAHGTSSTSFEQGRFVPRGALYLVPRDGGDPVRLSAGLGRGGSVDAFWPVFSPFVTVENDGTQLYWLAFYSRQDYGNQWVGTSGSRRRQLWVMAIDPTRIASGDPSYPPYWFDGQDTEGDNVAAFWAPTACRSRGEECSVSSQCCSGTCAASDPARPEARTCQVPLECRPPGASCGEDGDCCGGLVCTLHVCGYTPPG